MSRARDLADSADLNFDDGTLVIDSGNNRVGIGTSSPASKFELEDSVDGDMHLRINNTNTGTSARTFLLLQSDGATGSLFLNGANRLTTGIDEADSMSLTSDASASNGLNINASAGSIKFYNNNSEAARIDSSGNLLINHTSKLTDATISSGATGIALRGDADVVLISRDGGYGLVINRKTSDGDLLEFRKDGSTVGLISTYSSNVLIGTGATGVRFYDATPSVLPRNPTTGANADATIDFGSSGSRYKDLYLSGDLEMSVTTGVGSNAVRMTRTDTTVSADNTIGNWFFEAGEDGSEEVVAQISAAAQSDYTSTSSPTYLQFKTTASGNTSATEAMRIDSGGNLLVGKTSSTINSVGCELKPSLIQATSDGFFALTLNRKTSDGDIATFRKDNTTVGSIGAVNGQMYLGTGDTLLRFNDTSDKIYPVSATPGSVRDAAVDLGQSGSRFKDLYLSGGVYLGGTGAANYLDDYEEGTFTPNLIGGTSGEVTYTWREAEYTKIGRQVTVHIGLAINSVDTLSGAVLLGNLPYTVAPLNVYTSVEACGSIGNYANLSTSVTGLHVIALESSTNLQIRYSQSGTADAPLTNSDIAGNFTVRATLTYATT